MNSQTIVMCVVAFLIGMLLAHMLKNVCGCKTVEGTGDDSRPPPNDCIPKGEKCYLDLGNLSARHSGGASSSEPCCLDTYCKTPPNSNVGICSDPPDKCGDSPPCNDSQECVFGACVDRK